MTVGQWNFNIKLILNIFVDFFYKKKYSKTKLKTIKTILSVFFQKIAINPKLKSYISKYIFSYHTTVSIYGIYIFFYPDRAFFVHSIVNETMLYNCTSKLIYSIQFRTYGGNTNT